MATALFARTVDEETPVNRSSIRHSIPRTVAASVLLSLVTFAGAAIAAEATAPPVRTTVTTQTTTVSTQTTPAGSGPRSNSDPDEIRIKSLHDKLMIKASQESLWQDVVQVMRSNDEKMDALTVERHDKAATMTAVEDLRSYGEITEQHAIAIKTFVPVFEKLYDSMPAAQKATADKVFRTRGGKTAAKAK